MTYKKNTNIDFVKQRLFNYYLLVESNYIRQVLIFKNNHKKTIMIYCTIKYNHLSILPF